MKKQRRKSPARKLDLNREDLRHFDDGEAAAEQIKTAQGAAPRAVCCTNEATGCLT